MKTPITEMENSLDSLNRGSEVTEERINKLKYRLIKIIQSEEQNKKRMKKNNRASEKPSSAQTYT